MTLYEVARKLLDTRMRASTRATLIGYVVMVAFFGWHGFGKLTEQTVRNVKKRLKQAGIDLDSVDPGTLDKSRQSK